MELKTCRERTNVYCESETIWNKSRKESKDGNNPTEWPKGTIAVVGDAILNGMDEKLLSRKMT